MVPMCIWNGVARAGLLRSRACKSRIWKHSNYFSRRLYANDASGGNSNFKKLKDEEWHQRLTPMEYAVCRKGATEPPFSGEYYSHKASGVYACSCCGSELFRSITKYDSKSGWPSFYDRVDGAVHEREDLSHGMKRTEVVCSMCDAHLGHVFNDGPPPTGLRYCINSVCLKFLPTKNAT